MAAVIFNQIFRRPPNVSRSRSAITSSKAFRIAIFKNWGGSQDRQTSRPGHDDAPGHGTFSVNERQERQGRNPQTGKPIKIAAARVVKFKPGKALKEAVR